MDDIKTITPNESQPVKTTKVHKKRSTVFIVIASIMLFILLGVFAGLAYWGYQSYATIGDSAANSSLVPVSTKTAEEKSLDQAEADLKADDTLTTDEAQKQADDLDTIDISGI